MKVDILAIGVHPDDIELSCVGTLLSAVNQGKKVGLLDLTIGELGTRGSGELRLKEAKKSAELIGSKFRHNLGFRDGFFEITEENLMSVIKEIRYAQPDIILANSIDDRHPDHGRAAELVYRAAFLSGLDKIKTKYNGKTQAKWRPRVVYHYIQDKNIEPDLVVDITPFFDRKMECIKCFSSQFYNPESTEEHTPLTGQDFFEFIAGKARVFGRAIGAEYAELYTCHRYIGTNDITSLM
jgi:bacillithiol biosynthesis deacetylase BshB1